MFSIRKAIKQFKADFVEVDAVPSTSSLQSDTSSSRTPSEDISSYSASLNRSLRNRDELPIMQMESEDSSNSNEAVNPLQKRSLFQSLQKNSLNESSIEGQDQSKFVNATPPLVIPTIPMNNEFSRSDEKTSSSNDSSVPSIKIFPPAIPTKQVESLEWNPLINKVLPPDPARREFETEFAPSTNRQESKNAHYITVNEFGQPESRKRPRSPVEFSMSTNASSSKTTNGHAPSSTPPTRKIPEPLSNSTSFTNSEAYEGPMELDQSPVTQTSQQSRESPHEDSVIQTITPTVINDDNDQNTFETMERSDPPPITRTLPFMPSRLLEKRPDSFFKREGSVPGEFPLDGPSNSSSVQTTSVKSDTRTFPDSNLTFRKVNNEDNRVEARRANLNNFLINLATPLAAPKVVPTQNPETVKQTNTPWRPKLSQLQPIGESADPISVNGPSALSPDDVLARKMEELGRMRRMESRNQLARSTQQPVRTTVTPNAEQRPLMHQEDSSSDVTAMLRAAYIERQQELQTQLDKALAELQDVRAENKRLTSENQSQHRSIIQLKISLDEVKQEQDHSSIQIKNQLRDATASLTALNMEKKGWQDKLDSMQHKLSVAERQVRCLDHLTRQKLESRQETAYGQPKRRGVFTSAPASPDVIAAMSSLNEEIFQTCVQLVEDLERTSTHSNRHKVQAQRVLGDHLTVMMEDQATTSTSGYNTLLMQAVLEVFMVHWCSSIIEAFYPSQESFADLLVQLSAQTTRTPGYTSICGKQIRIVQSSTAYTDNLKFNEWVADIIKDLGLFLMMAGLRMKTQRAHLFSTKTLALVKAAYNLRSAMAEKDICGGLEVVIVAPDTPFQEKWMLDAHADPRKGDTDRSHVDFVAGTSGIGLQRQVSERVDGQFQSRTVVVLKPKVILGQALNVKD